MSRQLEIGLYNRLAGVSPLPTSADDRVYPRLPQNVTFPAIRYQRISTLRRHALDSEVGVAEALVQVDCMAESYLEAKTLADEVRTQLHGYAGAWSTLTAHLVSLETETDLDEIDGDNIRHWVSQRYLIYTNMD